VKTFLIFGLFNNAFTTPHVIQH